MCVISVYVYVYIGLYRCCFGVMSNGTGFDNSCSATVATVDMLQILNAILEQNEWYFSNFSVWIFEFSEDLFFYFAFHTLQWFWRWKSYELNAKIDFLLLRMMNFRLCREKTTLMNKNSQNAKVCLYDRCFFKYYFRPWIAMERLTSNNNTRQQLIFKTEQRALKTSKLVHSPL